MHVGKHSCPADRASSKLVRMGVSGNRQRMSRPSTRKVFADVDGLAAIHQDSVSDPGSLKLSPTCSPFHAPDEMPLWTEIEFTFLGLGFTDILIYN